MIPKLNKKWQKSHADTGVKTIIFVFRVINLALEAKEFVFVSNKSSVVLNVEPKHQPPIPIIQDNVKTIKNIDIIV